jgi:hypothetical protein
MSNILFQLKENVSLTSIKNMSAIAIANAYVANYIAALLLIRCNDNQGLRLLRDKQHVKLNKFSNNMSRPNFWGYIVFNSKEKNIASLLSQTTIKDLIQNAGRIISSRRLKLQTYTTLTDDKINWTDAAYSIKLLKTRFELNNSKLDNIANGIYFWDSLDEMAKGDLLYNVFSFLIQSDNDSNLLPRLRYLTDNKYLTVNSIVSTIGQKLNKVFRIFEDGENGGDSGGEGGEQPSGDNSQPNSGATTSKDVGTLPFKFDNGKIIKRRKRNWKIRKWKDPFISKKLGDYSNVKVN